MTIFVWSYLRKNKMEVSKLEKEFQFFTDNHDVIYQEYPNKYVVIYNESVVLAADSFDNALKEAIDRGLELGEFLIQQCTEGDSGYTQIFHSRAIF